MNLQDSPLTIARIAELEELADSLRANIDIKAKHIHSLERKLLKWHYEKSIPKPYEVLAILKHRSGGLVFDKVNSIFPIDENWEVVCWTHMPIDAIANNGCDL